MKLSSDVNSWRGISLGQNKVLVTHTDLDGVGCAYIFLKCYPTAQVYFADYGGVNELALQLMEQYPNADFLFTDISINEQVASLFNERGKVALLDHHASADWLNDYEWATVVQGKCGTRLIYEVMSDWFNIQDLEHVVNVIQDWDLWGHDGEGPSEEAIEYQFLFDFMGRKDFLHELLIDKGFLYHDRFHVILDKLMQKYEFYYQKTKEITEVSMKDGYRVGLTLADQHISLIGDRLCTELDLEYVMMMDRRNNKASLRGKGNVDLSVLAKEAGGGGHRRAAGIPLAKGL